MVPGGSRAEHRSATAATLCGQPRHRPHLPRRRHLIRRPHSDGSALADDGAIPQPARQHRLGQPPARHRRQNRHIRRSIHLRSGPARHRRRCAACGTELPVPEWQPRLPVLAQHPNHRRLRHSGPAVQRPERHRDHGQRRVGSALLARFPKPARRQGA